MGIWQIYRDTEQPQEKEAVFLEAVLAIGIMEEPKSNLEKVNTSILKDDFSSRIDPSISTSIAPMLLDLSNKFFQHWNQQATSCPSQQCLVDQIQGQKPNLVVAMMPDHNEE